jgi:hypothetical protein
MPAIFSLDEGEDARHLLPGRPILLLVHIRSVICCLLTQPQPQPAFKFKKIKNCEIKEHE